MSENKPSLPNLTLPDALTLVAAFSVVSFFGMFLLMVVDFYKYIPKENGMKGILVIPIFLFLSALAAGRVVWGILNAIRNPRES